MNACVTRIHREAETKSRPGALPARGRVRVAHEGAPAWGRLDDGTVELWTGERLDASAASWLAPVDPLEDPRGPPDLPLARTETSTAPRSASPRISSSRRATLDGDLRRHRAACRNTRFLNYEGELAPGDRPPDERRWPRTRRSTTSPAMRPANDVGLHDFRHADRGAMLRVKGQDGVPDRSAPRWSSAEASRHGGFGSSDLPQRRARPGGPTRGDLIWTPGLLLADLCRVDHARPRGRRAHRDPRAQPPDGRPAILVEVEYTGLGRIANPGRRGRHRSPPGPGEVPSGLRADHCTWRWRSPRRRPSARRQRKKKNGIHQAAAHRPRQPAGRRPRPGRRPLGGPVRAHRTQPAKGGRALLACNDEPYCLKFDRGRLARPRPLRLRARSGLLARRRPRPPRPAPAPSGRNARARYSSPIPMTGRSR